MRIAKDAFLVKEWLAADADARPPADASLADGISCDEAGCVAPMAGGGLVSLALRPDALADDCARVALVVTAKQLPPTCAAPVIPADRLRQQGALALRRTRNGFAIDAVRPHGSDRPWSPAIAGQTEAELNLVRSAAPRAVDATPAEADLQAED
jgi:competence protein ComEC